MLFIYSFSYGIDNTPIYYEKQAYITYYYSYDFVNFNTLIFGDTPAHLEYENKKIAIIGDKIMRNKFINDMNDFLPGFNVSDVLPPEEVYEYVSLNVPPFKDIVMEFDSVKKMNEVILNKWYTRTPQIEYAIVLYSYLFNNRFIFLIYLI